MDSATHRPEVVPCQLCQRFKCLWLAHLVQLLHDRLINMVWLQVRNVPQHCLHMDND